MSEHVRTARVGRRPQTGGEPSAADWLAHADPLSIMYWVDDIVAEHVTRPELPGRDAVIARATDLRALCRELAACRRRLARLPAPRRGSVLRFPRRTGGPGGGHDRARS